MESRKAQQPQTPHCQIGNDRLRALHRGGRVGGRTRAGRAILPTTYWTRPTFPRSRPISIVFGFCPAFPPESGVRFRQSDRLALSRVRGRRRRVRRAMLRALSAAVVGVVGAALAALVVGQTKLWSLLLPQWNGVVERAFAFARLRTLLFPRRTETPFFSFSSCGQFPCLSSRRAVNLKKCLF